MAARLQPNSVWSGLTNAPIEYSDSADGLHPKPTQAVKTNRHRRRTSLGDLDLFMVRSLSDRAQNRSVPFHKLNSVYVLWCLENKTGRHLLQCVQARVCWFAARRLVCSVIIQPPHVWYALPN